MGKQRRQSNRGKANRGGGSGGRGPVLRGSQPNRGGGAGANAADRRSTLSPQSSQAADDVIAGLTTGEITARDVSNMPDEGRMSIPQNMLPDAPEGYVYAEDRTLVPKSFYG